MSFHKIITWLKPGKTINTVIEIPKGSANKYEYDETTDEIRLDRVLHSSMRYPFDYGFVPQTRGQDGDHLDVLVVISTELFSGCIVAARPIGVVDMEDENGQDWKIIAVAENDPRLKEINELEDLGEHFKLEVQHFFEEYKRLENKKVKFKKWLSKKEAFQIIEDSEKVFAKEK
jgi:inorganic pyrophosphatase